MNAKQADALLIGMYKLLVATCDLPIRLNAHGHELEPFYVVRQECIETLRDTCGGDSFAQTLRAARARCEAIKAMPLCDDLAMLEGNNGPEAV